MTLTQKPRGWREACPWAQASRARESRGTPHATAILGRAHPHIPCPPAPDQIRGDPGQGPGRDASVTRDNGQQPARAHLAEGLARGLVRLPPPPARLRLLRPRTRFFPKEVSPSEGEDAAPTPRLGRSGTPPHGMRRHQYGAAGRGEDKYFARSEFRRGFVGFFARKGGDRCARGIPLPEAADAAEFILGPAEGRTRGTLKGRVGFMTSSQAAWLTRYIAAANPTLPQGEGGMEL
jgi:hypothetical protein